MRQGIVITSLMLIFGVVSPLSAVERLLIDFTTYNENIAQVVEKDQEIYEQFIAENPELDIRNFGWPEFAFEADDWNLENWKIELNPSSDIRENKKNSLLKNSPSQQHGNVLGVRLQFKAWENAFWAFVKTPYYFSHTYVNGVFVSQDENDQDAGLAIGMLANVGQIKNARSWVYGLNYDYTYGVRVLNEKNELKEYGFGSVLHEGWRQVAWNNPDYSDNPKDWAATKNPLYPFSLPYIKFDSLAFYKPAGTTEANFIGYVRDVSLNFDLAVVREDQDINDEAIWQMLAKDAIQTKLVMSKIVAEELLLQRKIGKLKAASDAEGGAVVGGADVADADVADADATQ